MEHWIGTLIPNNVDAGYKIAISLIEKARIKNIEPLNIVAINGSRETPASQEREKGLKLALAENPDVKLKQILYGEWNQELSYSMMKGLLNRYPDIKMIWAANDPMALGAIKALKENALKPGEDVFVSGLNWSNEAIENIQNGEMCASVGGHFMVPGWSLVILYDYHNGIDFKDTGTLELQIDIFDVITSSNANTYSTYLEDKDWDKIDFKMFSKSYNHKVLDYDFSLDKIFNLFPL